MARTKKSQQGWNAKSADTDTLLKLDIEAARTDLSRPNLRPRMAALQDLPMATNAISYEGSLLDWLNRCLTPTSSSSLQSDASSTSTAVTRGDHFTFTPSESVGTFLIRAFWMVYSLDIVSRLYRLSMRALCHKYVSVLLAVPNPFSTQVYPVCAFLSQPTPTTGDYEVLRVRHVIYTLCVNYIRFITFIQAFAAKIDQWDTHGLFDAEGSKGLLWLILGLGSHPHVASDAKKVYEMASGTSFHRYARVFWTHMLFDMLASQANLQADRPVVIVPSLDRLDFLRTKEGVKAVRAYQSIPV